MAYAMNSANPARDQNERCDIRIWSGDCKQSSFSNKSEKYLCVSCGMISDLNHEVRRDMFPHVSGDYSKLY